MPLAPPAADIQAAIEPKPRPVGDIVNDDTAAATYSAALEAWGERLSTAGGRLCRWTVANGATLPFECPGRP